MNNIQIVVFLYIVLRSLFYCTFCVNNWLSFSYSAILIVFCTFKFSSMTLSLSLSIMCIGYCAIENISFMVFIKQLKLRIFVQCNAAIQTGALPSKVRVVGLNPLPGTGSFFLPFFSSTSFLPFLTLHVYPGVCASVGRVLRVYLAGLLTIDFDHKHSIGRILGLW